jgi:hypothetical protein
MFNLSYIILDRNDLQSVETFGAAVLDDDHGTEDLDESDTKDEVYSAVCQLVHCVTHFSLQPIYHSKLANINVRAASSGHLETPKLDNRKVVNVVIAKDFNFAHNDVQIQVLEVGQCFESLVAAF